MMIRKLRENDITAMMQIWLETNMKAHHFIPKEYWIQNYAVVKELVAQGEVYVYEENHQLVGFIGLTDDYIAGIFITELAQSKGIGKQLLNYVKKIKSTLSLSVYQKNERAISFYQREQFIIQSENMDDSTNEKELIMKWHA